MRHLRYKRYEIYRCDSKIHLASTKSNLFVFGMFFIFISLINFPLGSNIKIVEFYYFIISLLILGIILSTIGIYYIITCKPFIIFNDGIQYPFKSKKLSKKYQDNFIPYSEIDRIIIRSNSGYAALIIEEKMGNRIIIPPHAIGEKRGRYSYVMKFPLKEMLSYWAGKRKYSEEKITTLFYKHRIFTKN